MAVSEKKSSSSILKITLILAVILLIGSVAAGFYYFKTSQEVQGGLEQKIQGLESQNQVLAEKISKSSPYLEGLNLLLEPSRQQLNLETKTDVSQADWLKSLADATDKTKDAKLQDILNKMTTGATEQVTTSMMEFMDYSIKEVISNLK